MSLRHSEHLKEARRAKSRKKSGGVLNGRRFDKLSDRYGVALPLQIDSDGDTVVVNRDNLRGLLEGESVLRGDKHNIETTVFQHARKLTLTVSDGQGTG